jgi:hypothetical protein
VDQLHTWKKRGLEGREHIEIIQKVFIRRTMVVSPTDSENELAF